MAIQNHSIQEGDLLVITASGTAESLQDLLDYSTFVLKEIQRGSCARILLDVAQVEYRLGTMDVFKAAEFTARSASNVKRVALVYDPARIRDAKFWETVVVNRGMDASVFKNHTAARRWLFEEPGG